MAKFRFRAEAALELRRKQDDEAQRALAEARRDTARAEAVREREQRLLDETLARARDEEARACDMARAIWHRHWMRRQRLVIEAAVRAVEERRAAERAAAEHAVIARRRLRSLERLRDRLWTAHVGDERRAEQKEMDVLGGLRFVARRGAPEGA
jgi:membrane protein involved in colicin uptake